MFCVHTVWPLLSNSPIWRYSDDRSRHAVLKASFCLFTMQSYEIQIVCANNMKFLSKKRNIFLISVKLLDYRQSSKLICIILYELSLCLNILKIPHHLPLYKNIFVILRNLWY